MDYSKIKISDVAKMNAKDISNALQNENLQQITNLEVLTAITSKNAEYQSKQTGNGRKSLYSLDGFNSYFSDETKRLKQSHRNKIRSTSKKLAIQFNSEPTKENFKKFTDFFNKVMVNEKLELTNIYTGSNEEIIEPVNTMLHLAKLSKFTK